MIQIGPIKFGLHRRKPGGGGHVGPPGSGGMVAGPKNDSEAKRHPVRTPRAFSKEFSAEFGANE